MAQLTRSMTGSGAVHLAGSSSLEGRRETLGSVPCYRSIPSGRGPTATGRSTETTLFTDLNTS